MENKNEQNCIELVEAPIVIYLPENTIDVEFVVKILVDGKLETVTKKMNAKELVNAFNDAEQNYASDNDVYYITEKGKDWLESLNNGLNSKMSVE